MKSFLLRKVAIVADLLNTLVELVVVLTNLTTQLLYLGLQWSLVLVWLAWALLAINWRKMWPVLAEGAWVPVVLLTILIALVWSSLRPGSLNFLGIGVIPNFWWHLGAVWLIMAATFFFGWLQGVLGWTPPEFNLEPPAHAAHEHGHGHHH